MPRAVRSLAKLLTLSLGVCAAAAAAPACATTKSAQTKPAVAELPRVPADPLALLVEDPESVIVARVQELQSAAVFARARPYIERATCVQLAEWESVLSATSRAALATRRENKDKSAQWLLVLDGRYSDGDAQRLLGTAIKQTRGADAANLASQTALDSSGRFSVTQRGPLAVSLLEARLLVLGTTPWVQAALASIAKPAAAFSESGLWRSVGTQLHCSERSACVLSTANGANAHYLEDGLANAGAKDLGERLQGADGVLAVTASEGLGLGFAAQLGSADAAQGAERELRDWLYQVNLVVRLTGMPAIFDRARLSTSDTVVRAELDVTKAELDAYEARAKPLFDREAPSCGAAHLP
jgi:hypothetical protein